VSRVLVDQSCRAVRDLHEPLTAQGSLVARADERYCLEGHLGLVKHSERLSKAVRVHGRGDGAGEPL
jgi:hypothetical protein